MALTPWPTEEEGIALAVEQLLGSLSVHVTKRFTIGDRPHATMAQFRSRLREIGPATSAVVERYAPGAPQAIRDEAVVRFSGYVIGATHGALARDKDGDLETDYVTNHADAFRRCGAAMLLSPWRVRRAGLVG